MADFDISVIEPTYRQFKNGETIPPAKKKQTVKELTEKNKWKFRQFDRQKSCL